MSDESLNETQPMPTSSLSAGETMPTSTGGKSTPSDTQPAQPPKRKRRFAWILIVLLAWIVLIGVVIYTGYLGYNSAVSLRIDQENTRTVENLDSQYELALENFASGDYEMARQRLEFIIDKDPTHEKAIYLLGQTLGIMQATATPTPITPTPTPTLTPTPDLRAVEEIFNAARTAMEAEDWDLAISTLLGLRQKDPAYRAVDVDSMLYVAFRYRGVDKILALGQLEGGMLDLSQAELFGPLDKDAQSYANFASLFVIGNSFWEVDWAQAAYYFGQVAPNMPNMHNGDFWYASQRYIEAMQHYIDQLVESENFCDAQAQMDALRAFNDDPLYEPTQVWIFEKCEGRSNNDDDDEEEDGGSSEETPSPENTPSPEVTPSP